MSFEPPLKGPLEEHLAPVLDESRIQAIKHRVEAEGHALERPGVPRWGVALSLLFALALALVWWSRTHEPRALALADGSSLPAAVTGTGPRELKLSDGSTISLAAETQAEVVANQPGKLTLLVRQGKARFEVNPRAHEQWLVEAGLVTVEVVGTLFTVERDTDGVRVGVERGTVIVRGDSLPDRLLRLEAGQSRFVSAEKIEAAKMLPVPPQPKVVGLEPPSPPSGETRTPAREPTASWRRAAAGGDYVTAWAALEHSGFEGIAKSTSRADELLLLADTARWTGHDAQAAQALEHLLSVAPADPNAPIAAFTLGRLELEKLNRPGAAAAHFEQAAASPALGPLAEDALARRVEALSAAGQPEAAQAAARAAVELFPEGAHAAELRRRLAHAGPSGSWSP
jgi:transmembrane sensor